LVVLTVISEEEEEEVLEDPLLLVAILWEELGKQLIMKKSRMQLQLQILLNKEKSGPVGAQARPVGCPLPRQVLIHKAL
jgi:hypothetical protein